MGFSPINKVGAVRKQHWASLNIFQNVFYYTEENLSSLEHPEGE